LLSRLRDECLSVMQFLSLDDARASIEACRVDYSAHQPSISLDNLTSSEFATKRQGAGRQDWPAFNCKPYGYGGRITPPESPALQC